MIPLDIVNYENANLDLKITEYIKKNIGDIIRVLLDYIEDDLEYDLVFSFQEITLRENQKNVKEIYMNCLKLLSLQY
jgi:hypothetical protein